MRDFAWSKEGFTWNTKEEEHTGDIVSWDII